MGCIHVLQYVKPSAPSQNHVHVLMKNHVHVHVPVQCTLYMMRGQSRCKYSEREHYTAATHSTPARDVPIASTKRAPLGEPDSSCLSEISAMKHVGFRLGLQGGPLAAQPASRRALTSRG